MLLEPIETAHLIREVDEALVPLLRSLEPDDWQRTAVGSWAVRDVASHLLDGALRRLALGRDAHRPPAPDRDLSVYTELVGYLDDLNASWIEATGRLSPRVLTGLLEWACPQLADYLESLDPEAEADFPVDWAGERRSRVWMDVAREFTERWHHQQQIREAVGAPGLEQERYLRPLLQTMIRALPRTYETVAAPNGTCVEIRIGDLEEAAWRLVRRQDRWGLADSAGEANPEAVIEIPASTAWRLFTKAVSAREASERARITGEERLARPFFHTLAIMA